MGAPETSVEPHGLDHDDFLREVHSFEFWFHSVEGYLSGRHYGHREDTVDHPPTGEERERLIDALCNYAEGESTALEGASGLVAIAPNQNARIFLSTQVADEGRHLEVLLRRLQELGVSDPEAEVERRAHRSLKEFRSQLLQLVSSGDWEAAIFAQNVILESVEFAVFQTHERVADPVTSEILEGVIKDERRHIGFGENELGRRLSRAPHSRARIQRVQERLNPLALDLLDATARDLGASAKECRTLTGIYLASIRRLGFC